jgi:hypothetical protein
MRFTVTCHGNDSLGLREMLERFANEQSNQTIALALKVMEVRVETDVTSTAGWYCDVRLPDEKPPVKRRLVPLNQMGQQSHQPPGPAIGG